MVRFLARVRMRDRVQHSRFTGRDIGRPQRANLALPVGGQQQCNKEEWHDQNGKSCFNSACEGRRPYSQTS